MRKSKEVATVQMKIGQYYHDDFFWKDLIYILAKFKGL